MNDNPHRCMRCSVMAAMACLLTVWTLSVETALAQQTARPEVRNTEEFNHNWRFHLRAEDGAETASHENSGWQTVRLPHDWAISGPFDESLPGNTGKLPWRGEGWYRKTFNVDAAEIDNRFYLNFDGVMAFPQVYVNGELAGSWDYGYMAFQVDATPFIKAGENTVAVHVDTTNHHSRWYPGAGINLRREPAPRSWSAGGCLLSSSDAATTRNHERHGDQHLAHQPQSPRGRGAGYVRPDGDYRLR